MDGTSEGEIALLRVQRNEDGAFAACARHGCIFGFPPLAVALVRPRARPAPRSIQSPGRFASVGIPRFFAPQRSRPLRARGARSRRFFRRRRTDSRVITRCANVASCQRAQRARSVIVLSLGERDRQIDSARVKERQRGREGAETCARECPSFGAVTCGRRAI